MKAIMNGMRRSPVSSNFMIFSIGRGLRGRRSARRGGPVSDSLSDDGGDAVLTHRYAVQRIRDLHRALLVRDDQQLRVLTQLLENGQQASEIRIVECRFNLVENVERARARLEDRHQQRDSRQ